MKRMFGLFLLGLLMISGCATTSSYTSEPERPGTVKFFNQNQGIYAHGVLFKGRLSERKLFAINPETGGVMFTRQPMGEFELGPAMSREFPRIGRLDLQPQADYTLYLIWTRFDGRVVNQADLIHFKTGINPMEDCRTDQLGRMSCASKIIDLPRARIKSSRRLRIHKTLYVGEWMKALLGF